MNTKLIFRGLYPLALATAIIAWLAGCGENPEIEGDSENPIINTQEIITNPGTDDDHGDQPDDHDANDEMDLDDIESNNEADDENDENDVIEFENEWRQVDGPATLTPNERIPAQQGAEQRRRQTQQQPDTNAKPPQPNPDGTFG